MGCLGCEQADGCLFGALRDLGRLLFPSCRLGGRQRNSAAPQTPRMRRSRANPGWARPPPGHHMRERSYLGLCFWGSPLKLLSLSRNEHEHITAHPRSRSRGRPARSLPSRSRTVSGDQNCLSFLGVPDAWERDWHRGRACETTACEVVTGLRQCSAPARVLTSSFS